MAKPTPATDTTTPRPAAPRGGLLSILRWILTTLVVAIVAGAAVLPRVFSTPERISSLVKAALPDLAADVTPGLVRLGWFGPIVLEDLAIVPRNGDTTPLQIHRVEVEHGLAAILMSMGDLGRLRIEGLKADIAFDGNHHSNLDSILPPPESPAAPPTAKTPRPAPVRVKLEIEDAIVRISGPWTTDPWVSKPMTVHATLANGDDGLAVWTIEPVQLLDQAELQQTVAHEVLAYIVPVFADSARTSGRFSLRLDGARFPVGRPEEAQLSGLLAMHEVKLGPGPLVVNMFQSSPLGLPTPPTVVIADEANVEFRLAERRVWHKGLEFGLPLPKQGQRLDVQSQGSVGLDDRSLDLKLALPIPADLPQDRPLVAALAGKQISLGVGGSLDDPKVIFDGSIRDAAGQVLVDFLDRLRNGPRPQSPAPSTPTPTPTPTPVPPPSPEPPTTSTTPPPSRPGSDVVASGTAPATTGTASPSPRDAAKQAAADAATRAGANPDTAEAIVDIVGGVLDEVARRRAERRAAEAANPDQPAPPPRRGRLFQPRSPITSGTSSAPATAPR